MFLTQIIYCSTAVGLNEKGVENILASARKHNEKSNVTGLLVFSHEYFLQCLEGSRTAVNETYWRILNDKRHKNVVLMRFSEIAERNFSDWSMAYIPQTKLTQETVLKYSPRKDFNPYAISDKSALKMMNDLAAHYVPDGASAVAKTKKKK